MGRGEFGEGSEEWEGWTGKIVKFQIGPLGQKTLDQNILKQHIMH